MIVVGVVIKQNSQLFQELDGASRDLNTWSGGRTAIVADNGNDTENQAEKVWIVETEAVTPKRNQAMVKNHGAI